MYTKKMILSILLVLALIVSPILPPSHTTALAANIQTLTIENKTLYTALITCLDNNNTDALQNNDDEKQQMTLDLDKVTYIKMTLNLNITGDNFKHTLETLFSGCTNLTNLCLSNCNLREIDLSAIANRESLKELYLVECSLDRIPELTLPNLIELCLSKNNLSADGACDSLTKTGLPSLYRLYLDDCEISNIDFIQNLGELRGLSLADNKLTDSSILALAGMVNPSKLTNLNLGVKVKIPGGTSWSPESPSKNTFKDYEALASLAHFPSLEKLDLSGLGITSIQPFIGIKNKPQVTLEMNNITDYTGYTSGNNFSLDTQRINLYGDFTAGQEIELPEFMKRILDPADILYSSKGLTYTNCHLSDDNTKIVIEKNDASVKVINGKLYDSTITFKKKMTPSYTIPECLSAAVGDTLSSVILPEGFSWKEPAQIFDEEGAYTFQAVYTPADTNKYLIVDNINIPVTVMAKQIPTPEPTPTPEPIPETTPTIEPSLTPITTLAPEPTPETTLTPEIPTPTPEIPTSTPKPDESKLTGNQIEKRTDLPILLSTGKQNGKNAVKLTWNKWSGCSGYEVYWSYCDGKQNFQKLKTVKKNEKRVCVHKKLKKTRAYKYYVATYRIKSGIKNYLSKSSVIHVAMKEEKHTNIKKIKLNKTKLVLQSNKTFQIKATAIKENKKKQLLNHERIFRYYTGNKEVAAVTKNGKIKAKKAGTCTIFVIANNGVAKTIELTVT